MLKKTILLLLLAYLNPIFGQPWFLEEGVVFNSKIIPRVDITINEDSLAWIYDNVNSDHEFKALFVFTTDTDSDTISDIGFRLRGNTSRVSAKKSFKISFNTFESGRKYHGLEKMNLNGEHNDPSVIRSHLVWNLFNKMHVPGSRSNHVDLYINGRFYGLYINVEHIDEEFVKSRFDNNIGNLYKCLNPANLAYRGNETSAYKNNGYFLQTNTDKDDYSDLINFIKVLKESNPEDMPLTLEPIFNMNGFLRYLAVEIFTGHWDGYSGNKNNFYLFNNAYTGKFEFMPYDVDNTFGIDWFGIDWANRDIYRWWSDWEDMPLDSKTFGNQVYRDRFSFFMNELITTYADTLTYFNEIDAIEAKISASAEADLYRPLDYGWSFDDFKRSYTETLEKHVKYGLKEYIATRINSIKQQLVLNPIAPIIENVYHNFPKPYEAIEIKASIVDDEPNYSAKIYYKINEEEWLSDDMIQVGGSLFKITIKALGSSGTISYYIEATDASDKISREPYSGEITIKIGASDSKLLINEFMASNQNTILDNYGEAEDWIEIYNAGDIAIDLKGKYLTDDFTNTHKWSFSSVILEPGQYYVVWADNDMEQGNNHTNFKLSQTGESLGIFDSFETGNAPIDTFTYLEQTVDVSSGKNSEGILQNQDFITPNGENGSADLAYITFHYNMNKQIFDGNFEKDAGYIDIAGTFNDWQGSYKIFDSNGDGILSATLFGFFEGELIEYKARMLANWNGSEFINLGDAGNRVYTLEKGYNELSHWFNDAEMGINSSNSLAKVNIYPNPTSTGFINITADKVISKVSIFDTQGLLISEYAGNNEGILGFSHNLQTGIYLVQVESSSDIVCTKIVVF